MFLLLFYLPCGAAFRESQRECASLVAAIKNLLRP